MADFQTLKDFVDGAKLFEALEILKDATNKSRLFKTLNPLLSASWYFSKDAK